MFDNLKQNIPLIQLIIGFSIYIALLVCTTAAIAVLWALLVVFVWLISSIIVKTYNIYSFIYVLCTTGIIVSISFFFLQGVEELPYPRGALMFHLENITKACLLFFISSIPLIIISFNKRNREQFLKREVFHQTKDRDGLWEEATEEDLQSGRYDPL